VSSEEELDRFLGRMFRRIGRGIGRVVRSPVGRALGGILKGVARRALPIVGGALGSMVAPGLGTAIGSRLGAAAGRMFGLELEGLSAEDQEFELARRYVRLAASATRRAALAPVMVPPQVVARRAFNAAARRHAPGLARVFVPMAQRRRPVVPRYAPAYATRYASAYAPRYVSAYATRYAPAYAPRVAPAYAPGVPRWRWPRTGQWVRQGRNVVLVGYYG
jgi:uncharacterized protein (DUF697 family)